jgi:predicted nuclease with TOPRIM domain
MKDKKDKEKDLDTGKLLKELSSIRKRYEKCREDLHEIISKHDKIIEELEKKI